jgi:hypothetical protein
MDLSLLTTLKEKLVNAEEFHEVMTYFFDHFGDDPHLFEFGERVDHSLLEAILQAVGEQLFGHRVEVDRLIMTRLPEYQFVHGGGFLGGKIMTVLYFEDINKGLLAVAWGGRTGETKFVRFTGVTPPDPRKPSLN